MLLGLGKAKKLEDLKIDELHKEKIKQEVQQAKLLQRIKETQKAYDRRRDLASEPGVSAAEKSVAAFQMSQASKKKTKAEADLQQVLTKMTVLDSTIDIIQNKEELRKRGIWKKINEMDATALENQLDSIAFTWKESNNKLQTIVNMFEKDPTDVAFDRGAEYDQAMKDIEQMTREKQS